MNRSSSLKSTRKAEHCHCHCHCGAEDRGYGTTTLELIQKIRLKCIEYSEQLKYVVYLHTLYVDYFSAHKMNENENLEQEMIISLELYFTTVCEMTTQRNHLRP